MPRWPWKADETPEHPAAPAAPAAPEPTPAEREERMVERAAAAAASAVAGMQIPVQQQPAPVAPGIPDVEDSAIQGAYEAGDLGEYHRLSSIRHRADLTRTERRVTDQFQPAIAAGLGQINAMTKRTILAADPYYAKDAPFKRTVDDYIGRVTAGGNLLTEENLALILNQARGEHHTRLVSDEAEARIRQQREQSQTPRGRGTGGHTADGPSRDNNYNLSADNVAALSVLDGGRGRTADEFAARLPLRRVKVREYDENLNRYRETVETRGYRDFSDTLKDRAWAETELARQHAIIRGELPPRAPITPRS